MKDLTIFINGEDVSVEKALKTMTDEWVDDGNYCAQTVIDMRDALNECLKKSKVLTIKSQPTTSLTRKIMTKNKALLQSLSREDKLDWLIPDFLNLEVVDDKDFEVPVIVKNLSEIQAKVALGIAINHIKNQNKKLKKIKELI